MNTKPAAPVIFTVSLMVLIGGGAGTAAWGGPVQDDRAATTVVGIARGEVVVRDYLSPTKGADPIRAAVEQAAPQARSLTPEANRELHASAVEPGSARILTPEANRELHASAVEPGSARVLTPEANRELHASAVEPQSDRAASADVRRELHSQPAPAQPPQRQFSGDAIREMKSGAPQDDTVDDYLSPLGGSR
jgi:hypothetical protein